LQKELKDKKSAGGQPTSPQCSLTPNQHQPPITNQPAVLFSNDISVPTTSQQNTLNINQRKCVSVE